MEASRRQTAFFWLRRLRHALVIAPLVCAIYSSVQPSFQAFIASQTLELPQVRLDRWEAETSGLTLKRTVQQHFRKYNIYIPLDDIMLKPIDPGYFEKLFLLLEKTCGHGKVYVWIPLIFRFPFFGNKVMEWCWIPKVKILQSIAD